MISLLSSIIRKHSRLILVGWSALALLGFFFALVPFFGTSVISNTNFFTPALQDSSSARASAIISGQHEKQTTVILLVQNFPLPTQEQAKIVSAKLDPIRASLAELPGVGDRTQVIDPLLLLAGGKTEAAKPLIGKSNKEFLITVLVNTQNNDSKNNLEDIEKQLAKIPAALGNGATGIVSDSRIQAKAISSQTAFDLFAGLLALLVVGIISAIFAMRGLVRAAPAILTLFIATGVNLGVLSMVGLFGLTPLALGASLAISLIFTLLLSIQIGTYQLSGAPSEVSYENTFNLPRRSRRSVNPQLERSINVGKIISIDKIVPTVLGVALLMVVSALALIPLGPIPLRLLGICTVLTIIISTIICLTLVPVSIDIFEPRLNKFTFTNTRQKLKLTGKTQLRLQNWAKSHSAIATLLIGVLFVALIVPVFVFPLRTSSVEFLSRSGDQKTLTYSLMTEFAQASPNAQIVVHTSRETISNWTQKIFPQFQVSELSEPR